MASVANLAKNQWKGMRYQTLGDILWHCWETRHQMEKISVILLYGESSIYSKPLSLQSADSMFGLWEPVGLRRL
jgi:hypothetical protein